MHPSNIPSLPSFLAPEYLAASEENQTVLDVWNDLKDCVSFYLPQEHKEPSQAYRNRLKRCQFDNRFEPAIKGLSGLLSCFNFNEDVAASIVSASENIDNLGNNLYIFFREADQTAIRDGWCGVLVDFPPGDIAIESQADFIQSQRRPYLVLIDRRDILNWRHNYIDGAPTLTQVTIRERRILPEGEFGSKEEIFYRVLTPGLYRVFQIVESKNREFTLVLIEEGETSLDFVPLVYYSVSKSDLFSAKPPLINLAKLNIEHFQKRSQLNEVLRKCNLPVPVRKGLITNLNDLKNAPPLVIGPNNALDIPVNGDFYFAEPSGVAVTSTEANIEKLEIAMDRLSLAFLTGGESEKTATEVLLNAAQTSASLKGMAEQKQSNIQRIFEYWTAYTGEQNGGTINLDESILQAPISPEATNRLTELAQTGFISHETLLLELKQGKILSRDFDVQRELKLTGNNQDEKE